MAQRSAKPAVFAVIAGVLGIAVGTGVTMWLDSDDATAANNQANQQQGGAQGGPPGGGGGPPPANVRVAAVARESVQSRFKIIGRLNEIRRTTVAAEVSGKVIDVPVDEGDAVTGGETTLARIEDTMARIDLAEAEADVASARAQLDQSQRDLEYLEQLERQNAAKPREVADARATVASNKADLDAAVAARDRVREQLQRVTVTAPFDGWVVDKQTEVGQWASAGSAVAEIISRGEIEAVLNVPERLINRVTVGQSMELLVDALDERVDGEVTAVTPAGGNTARTFPVQVRMPDMEGQLKPGMSVTAFLPTSERENRLVVPRDAVQFQSTGAVVWVAQQQQEQQQQQQQGEGGPSLTATPVQVRVLFGIGPRYAIEPVQLDALAPDMLVVVEGAERLISSQPLIPQNSAIVSDGDDAAATQPADEG